MNYKIIFHTVGRILQFEAIIFIIPLIISIIYGETLNVISFLVAAAIALAIGFVLTYNQKGSNDLLFEKEGFAIVAIAWILMSAVGAIPYVISGEIPSYVDAFFETVSGFTTTGASVLTNVEDLSKGILFWRSFTHWLGGMGVLIFIMAILPHESGRSIHILRAEMPGPMVGKITPKLKETARILYLIYIAMTIIETILLKIGGMPLYESLLHAFGTAGTSGFGIKSDSLAGYAPHLQWMIMIFMLLGGINFNLYYLIFAKQFKAVANGTEIRIYFGIILVSGIAVTINILPLYDGLAEAIRQAFFHVSSLITTTGYSISNYALWPSFSKTLLLVLMFIGGCAGSTAGGIKILRYILVFKAIFRDIKQMLHPSAVASIRFDGKIVDDKTINGISLYFAVYFIIFFIVLLLLSFEPFDFETNFTATAACFNNIGAGLGEVGPLGNYAAYSPAAKLLLVFTMLLGRLEIFPILMLIMPSFWNKK